MKYNGTAYHGWQRQENAVTVQQVVEEALFSLFREKIPVTGCSRTDAGVHANCFKCNFSANKFIPHDKIISGLNFFLPNDIAVFDSVTVPPHFNARFDCKGKEYIYQIYCSRVRDPFYQDRALFCHHSIDAAMLNKEAHDYLGTHDFSAFRAIGSNVTSTVRTVSKACVEQFGPLVVFHVQADGFLYNMVRIMAGTLLYIAEGKISQGSIPDIIASKDRTLAGKTLPPDGLYLNQVFY